MRRTGSGRRVAHFGAFTAGVMISGRIFRRASRDAVDLARRLLARRDRRHRGRARRINDVFLGALARTLLLGDRGSPVSRGGRRPWPDRLPGSILGSRRRRAAVRRLPARSRPPARRRQTLARGVSARAARRARSGKNSWRATLIAAATGSARNVPTIPNAVDPTTTANRAASGWRCTARPRTAGIITTSSIWRSTNRNTTAVDRERPARRWTARRSRRPPRR